MLSADGRSVLLNLHAQGAPLVRTSAGTASPTTPPSAGAALREAREESGLTELRIAPGPVHLDEHAVPFCAAGVDVHHLDVRFAAAAAPEAEHAVSEESLDVRWWPVDALPDLEDEMHRLISAARAALVVR